MPPNDADHRLALLHARYADSLPAKRAALDGAWQALAANPGDAASWREMGEHVHRLCGSASAYGYAELGERACAADRQFTASPVRSRAGIAQVARVVGALFDALDAACAMRPAAPAQAATLRVLLAEDDSALARQIATELEVRGCTVRVESASADLRQHLTVWPCHAVVLDCRAHARSAAAIAAFLRAEPALAAVSLVCFGLEHQTDVRRAALAAGCDAVVARNDGIDRLLDVIRGCVARPDRGEMTFR